VIEEERGKMEKRGNGDWVPKFRRGQEAGNHRRQSRGLRGEIKNRKTGLATTGRQGKRDETACPSID